MGLPVRPGLARLWPHEKLINISHVRRQRLLRPRPSEENRLVGWIAHIKTFKMICRLCMTDFRQR